jgi:hypothetical protein
MDGTAGKLGETTHNPSVLRIEFRLFVMGNDPNRSCRFTYVKWNDQRFDDGKLYLVEILEITTRISKKLRRISIKGDSTGRVTYQKS